MKRLFIEEQVERFLKFEDDEYMRHAQYIMLTEYENPDEAIRFYTGWLYAAQKMRDGGMQVFVFDPDAQGEIEDTDGALEPEEVYNAFPYDAAYVKIKHPILDGFVVMRNHDEKQVEFQFLMKENWVREHADDSRGLHAKTTLVEVGSDKLCNLVSYISAANADLNLVYTPPSERQLANRKKKRSAATVTEVGARIGAQLREYKRYASESAGGGGHVRPHMRRAHWHRFWTGPRSGERKLILKWLEPIFVNPDRGESATTIHKVV